MKKFIPYIVVGVLVLIIVTVFLSLAKVQHMVVIKEGNLKKLPLKMELHKYQDSYCGMVIDELDYASQVVASDGRTWFFHDHGDFVQWLENKDFKNEAVIWVMSRDTHKWIDGRKAYYSLNETTPMGFGFGAYENKGAGMVDFETMRLKMLRGETLKNPKIRKQILGK
jgi:nitrous oxide reductase accessory protein NosL